LNGLKGNKDKDMTIRDSHRQNRITESTRVRRNRSW